MLEFEELRDYLISENDCNICNGNDVSEWGSRGVLKLVKCNNCGLVYINPRLNGEGLSKLYSNYFQQRKNNKKLSDMRNIMYSLEVEFLMKNVSEHKKILDVGCAGGLFLNSFPDSFIKIGTEFDSVASNVANNSGIRCYTGDFLDLNISEIPLDIIIFRGVIEHVTNPRKTLEKASQMLSQNGLIYITSTPNLDSVCAEVYRGYWNMVGPDHLYYFNETILSGILNKYGLNLFDEHHFYEETPYKNLKSDFDILKQDLVKIRNGENIHKSSPPFWGNMLSLLYKKQG